MLRRLFFLAFVVGSVWLFRRLVNGVARVSQRRPPGRSAQATATRMVRDRVCNTFVPESSALHTSIGGVEHYFCSEGCRRRFLEAVSTAPTPAR